MVSGLGGPFANYLGDAFALSAAQIDEQFELSLAIDVGQWFVQRREALGVRDPDALGQWPKAARPWLPVIEAVYERLGVLKSTVNLLLVPVQASWQVPIVLNFGGFNDCPTPAELGALLRHWDCGYGAQPVSIGSQHSADTLGLLVERPPMDRFGALGLAKELYVSADFEMLSPAQVAAHLLGVGAWTLWWD
ncbi:MAG TPA: DUF4253 domain-containing protein [Polyangiaceae bacterium]|jgi:hypothetical protein|nr:DUF4253 domain-containing protein [Polyangiaceae bacterium]